MLWFHSHVCDVFLRTCIDVSKKIENPERKQKSEIVSLVLCNEIVIVTAHEDEKIQPS